MARLNGKAAIITGAGSGIGRASARLFAAEGARVAILDRNLNAAHDVEQELRQKGQEAIALRVDISDWTASEAAVAEAGTKLGGLDILMNNAATYALNNFDQTTREDWHRVLDTNLTAYAVCGRVAAREMRKRGGGSIVNICSVHRLISEPNSGAYAASKGGVAQLTRNLAIELAPDNIVVNSISPGFIRTAMSVVEGVDETTTERFRTSYTDNGRIPLRRAGQPEEIAAAALFLASRECAYLTGADLVVDGGLTITL